MDELLNNIDSDARDFMLLMELVPECGRKKEVGIMIQAVLDRTYQIRIELMAIRAQAGVKAK